MPLATNAWVSGSDRSYTSASPASITESKQEPGKGPGALQVSEARSGAPIPQHQGEGRHQPPAHASLQKGLKTEHSPTQLENTLEMVREGWVAPTHNLEDPDPRCAPLDYVIGAPRALDAEAIVSNNFAFGGVNTSLVFRRWPTD